MSRSLPEFMPSPYAPQHTESREAYKNKLEMAQVFADLERRLKGKKRVADELSAYLFD
jgi:hypothetical protein